MIKEFKIFKDIDKLGVSYVVYSADGNDCMGHFLGDEEEFKSYLAMGSKIIECDWR